MAKYDALEAHLRSLTGDTVRLTFEEINTMLPKGLPPSAYEHPPFWSNTDSHVHAVAWQRAGWRTVGHNLEQQYVDFRRFASVPPDGPQADAEPADEAAALAASDDAAADGTADDSKDGENRQLVAIKTRRGQPEFRDRLLSAYDSTCAVSGSTVEPLLEAAHIVPHALETNYTTSNGLALRADIHTLFDLHLIAVDAGGRVAVSRSLERTEYAQYRGRRLVALPADPDDQPSPDRLKRHHDLFLAREDALDA
ncbi:MAG: HNH endonuclease [Paraburkholderia sp.]|uniref:HNH endonuclease n=1 Tax=Paraburkholderia sp. TaxID=1926495 RepID=UPI001213FEC3|nr:HNH endonuclease [Paraburkholderia sp.]TAM01114.1 MAG: HNH endonuclease [Paraburkholderia sp.]TAM30412.1 MAG: HNH endonuclease [Paraburkholderia sp.]